jgi:hypothetical protein
MAVSSDSTTRSPFRFSLRTALALIALIAIGLALWLSYKQNRQNELLRAENIRLRNEVGEILVEPGDENKLHAVSIPTAESMLWKWRIFVPAGRTFWLYAAADELAAGGDPPKNFAKGTLFSGEQTVQLTLHKNSRDR